MNKFVNAEDVKDLINGLDSLPWEDEVEYMVDSLIAADVAEVKHGSWKLNKDGGGTCDQCKKTQKGVWDYDNWQNYCGCCGAKMEGVTT